MSADEGGEGSCGGLRRTHLMGAAASGWLTGRQGCSWRAAALAAGANLYGTVIYSGNSIQLALCVRIYNL
eukprot:SAG22_NODE_1105_length_5554_cov_3.860495_2_plen_70_part_00